MKKEVARDIMALGSIPFFLIVIVRIIILENPEYLFQIVFAGIFFLPLYAIFKSSLHLGLGLILVAFLSLYYQENLFTAMAIILYLGMIISATYIKIEKKKIIQGIIFGLISTTASYLAALWIF